MYIYLKKNKKYSYNLLIINSKFKIIKKVGCLSFNSKLNKFILIVKHVLDLLLCLKYGIYINKKSYINANLIINYLVL